MKTEDATHLAEQSCTYKSGCRIQHTEISSSEPTEPPHEMTAAIENKLSVSGLCEDVNETEKAEY